MEDSAGRTTKDLAGVVERRAETLGVVSRMVLFLLQRGDEDNLTHLS